MAVPASSDTSAARQRARYLEMVEDHRVHGSLYTDPTVFDDEQRAVFDGWVYVAHESEVTEAGDYCLKTISTQSVVISRDAEGHVHDMMDRCGYLRNLLCHDQKGHTGTFRCPPAVGPSATPVTWSGRPARRARVPVLGAG